MGRVKPACCGGWQLGYWGHAILPQCAETLEILFAPIVLLRISKWNYREPVPGITKLNRKHERGALSDAERQEREALLALLAPVLDVGHA